MELAEQMISNILSCLRDLQNMTNYFLMSLAVADLLVCLIVMPFGAVTFFKGERVRGGGAVIGQCDCCNVLAGCWPLSQGWCVFYQTCDVLACSVSILHLMFISIGGYSLTD